MSETDYTKGKPKVHPLCYTYDRCSWLDDKGVTCFGLTNSSHVCIGCKKRPEQNKKGEQRGVRMKNKFCPECGCQLEETDDSYFCAVCGYRESR